MTVDVKALVAKAKADLDLVKPSDQDVLIGSAKVTVRLWPLTGAQWRDVCSRHLPREESLSDQALGYNLTGVLMDYPKVYAVDGDEVTDISEDWSGLCAEHLSAPDLKALEYLVWGINEYDPAQKLASAGKASAGRPRKKRS